MTKLAFPTPTCSLSIPIASNRINLSKRLWSRLFCVSNGHGHLIPLIKVWFWFGRGPRLSRSSKTIVMLTIGLAKIPLTSSQHSVVDRILLCLRWTFGFTRMWSSNIADLLFFILAFSWKAKRVLCVGQANRKSVSACEFPINHYVNGNRSQDLCFYHLHRQQNTQGRHKRFSCFIQMKFVDSLLDTTGITPTDVTDMINDL